VLYIRCLKVINYSQSIFSSLQLLAVYWFIIVNGGLFPCLCSDVSPQQQVVIDQPTVSVRPGEDALFECSSRSRIAVEALNWTRYGDQLPPGTPLLSFKRHFTSFVETRSF